MSDKQINNEQYESLNLQDLLIDEQADILTDYLSVSIENIGVDTKVSVTTVEDTPNTYSSTLSNVTFTDFQYLIEGNINTFHE